MHRKEPLEQRVEICPRCGSTDFFVNGQLLKCRQCLLTCGCVKWVESRPVESR